MAPAIRKDGSDIAIAGAAQSIEQVRGKGGARSRNSLWVLEELHRPRRHLRSVSSRISEHRFQIPHRLLGHCVRHSFFQQVLCVSGEPFSGNGLQEAVDIQGILVIQTPPALAVRNLVQLGNEKCSRSGKGNVEPARIGRIKPRHGNRRVVKKGCL